MASRFIPDDDTSLLLHSDHADGSVAIADSSKYGHALTIGGDTHHSTDQEKINSSSIYFDGTGDNIAIADHAIFDWGTADGR